MKKKSEGKPVTKERILKTIGLSYRAGLMTSGFEAIELALHAGAVALLILAKDGSDKQREKLKRIAKEENTLTSDFATAEELDEIYKLTAWDEKELSREPIYEHISEEDGFAVSKYLLEDYENEKRFLMAVKMKLEHSEEEGWSAETTGLALAPDPSGGDDIQEYSESDLISYAKDIISNSKSCGDAKQEGVSILVWDPDTDIFGREKTTEI